MGAWRTLQVATTPTPSPSTWQLTPASWTRVIVALYTRTLVSKEAWIYIPTLLLWDLELSLDLVNPQVISMPRPSFPSGTKETKHIKLSKSCHTQGCSY